ncbi:hypothetical protein SAMN05421788_10570 [Filimonas lacunae]|uniref:Uncharacterized protein n=1 Tax=Filimonas lacunae TaxID=477680 RepID=A0A1N7QDA8_9BACT|nr:hypothetical protein [Filimonas lacunae]SIT20853.1 hypothetical protein SAMN05421788_10570 [Filimonas lacunae]
MKDKKQEIIDYAKSLGINLTIDPALKEKHGSKVLASEKLAKVNEMLSNMKSLPK